MKIIMVYFSATQNTAKIAEVITNRLVELSAEVDILDVTTPSDRNSGYKTGDTFILDVDGNFISKLCHWLTKSCNPCIRMPRFT